MRRLLLAVSLLVVCASGALVAQMRFVPDAPGRWKPWSFTAFPTIRTQLGARPADVKALEAHLLRLNEIIKGIEGITTPIGFSVETSGALGLVSGRELPLPGEPALTVRPLPAVLYFGAFNIVEYGTGAKAKREDGGETALLAFFVNEVSQPLFAARDSRVPEFDKLDTDVVRLAKPARDLFGMPRYGSDTIVIKKTDAEIWTAVTMAETLELVARSIDQRLTDARDTVNRLQANYDDRTDPGKRAKRMVEHKQIAATLKDPKYLDTMTKADEEIARTAADLLPSIAREKAAAAKIEQELADARAKAAGLSAADKAAPACYVSGGASSALALSRFRQAPTGGCDPLVRPNWSLFNPALPRSAPQLLTIAHFERCLPANQPPRDHAGRCTANMRVLESIDKAALKSWLQ